IDITFGPTEELWTELRRREHRDGFTCPGCAGRMHPMSWPVRRGKKVVRVIRIFKHNPGQAPKGDSPCGGPHESLEHHETKTTIAAAANRAGFTAECEVYHPNGTRSDVVATNPTTGTRFGFEVQFAPLAIPDAEDRTIQYLERGGVNQLAWLHTGQRQWEHIARPCASTVPAFTSSAGSSSTCPEDCICRPPQSR
ncbi:MAG TPA: hypothetical protein VGQ20_14880, partial [Acidimicrobiales bacterium]|nr:hypothetical protein [Acidimicrobiales bacterium]